MFKDIKQTVKHTIIYGAGNFASKLVGFILMPLYTNEAFFSVADYGILSLVDVTSQILIAMMGLSFSSGLMRWYWDNEFKDRQKSLFFTIMTMTVFSSVVIGGCIWSMDTSLVHLLASGEKYEFEDQLPYVIKLLVLYSVFSAVVSPVLDLLRLKSRSLQYSVVNIFRLVATLGITVYFVVGLGRGLAGVYEAQLLGVFLQFLILLPFILNNSRLRLETKAIRQILSYSYPLMLPAVVGGILSICDRYMLKSMQGLDDVAIYSLGYKIGNTLKIFIIASVQLALTPLIMKKMNDPDNQRFYSKVFTYLAFGGMFCLLGLNLLSREIILVATTNPDFWVSVYVVPFITFSIFFGMLRDFCVIGLQIKKKTKIISFSIMFIMIVNVGLNLLFIPVWGIYGTALATVLAQILSWVILYYCAQKAYPIPYELGKLAKILIVGLVVTCFGLLTVSLDTWIALLVKFMLLLLFPLILYFWNFYEPMELQHIKGIWDKWKDWRKWKKNLKQIK